MKNKTAMMELIQAHRDWIKEWDLYDQGLLKTKPISSDEFYKPFLEEEKEQIVNAFDAMGYPSDFTDAEQYYNETYKQD